MAERGGEEPIHWRDGPGRLVWSVD